MAPFVRRVLQVAATSWVKERACFGPYRTSRGGGFDTRGGRRWGGTRSKAAGGVCWQVRDKKQKCGEALEDLLYGPADRLLAPQAWVPGAATIGYQPRMKADPKSPPNQIRWEFAGGTNLDPAKDAHMRGGTLTLLDSIRRLPNQMTHADASIAGVRQVTDGNVGVR